MTSRCVGARGRCANPHHPHMASALRQRAVTEAAAAAVGGRIEPRLEPAGMDVPVMTDEVVVTRAAPGWRSLLARLPRAVPAWPARWHVAPKMLAWSLAGLLTTLLAVGLSLYFWPTSAPESDKASATPAVAAASVDAHDAPTPHAVPAVSSRSAKGLPSIVPPLPAATVAEAPVLAPRPTPPASAVPAPISVTPAVSPGAPEPAKLAEPATPVAPVAATAPITPAEAPEPAAAVDNTYGVDVTGNGLPDALDRWMARSLRSPATQEAARSYYATVLPLATKVHLGISLSLTEKRTVLRAAECYLVTAADDGLRTPPNLNDQVLRLGGEAAARMKGLFRQLQGVDYPVSGRRQQACG